MTLHSTVLASVRPLDRPLHGTVTAPGDKSISHRCFLLGGLASGITEVTGLLEADDVLRTGEAMALMGAKTERLGPGHWRIEGVGHRGGLQTPNVELDFGNAGTGSRLTMGLVAGQSASARFVGDASLSSRPMERVLAPLRLMGGTCEANHGKLPVTVTGRPPLTAIDYAPPQASAQVKSSILLAALGADGEVVVREAHKTRDHSENMLRAFGAQVTVEDTPNDPTKPAIVRMQGGAKLVATPVDVAGDPSSAAFLIAAATLIPGSDVIVRNVMMNPTRAGFVAALQAMGADIVLENPRLAGGEQVADLHVRHAQLHGAPPPAANAASMIDEYPILAVCAAFATGTSLMEGLAELRVKESDRLARTAALLEAAGVHVETGSDWLKVQGLGATGVRGWGQTDAFDTHGDHRLAMSGLILGLASQTGTCVNGADMINTSFPSFFSIMESLGARFAERPQ